MPPRSRESPTRPLTAARVEPGNTSPAIKAATTSGTVNEQDPSDAKVPNVDGEPPAGKAPPPRAAGQTRRARGRGRRGSAGRRGRGRGRGRRGPETTGDSDDDSDDDGQGGSGVDAKKASQQRMIEAMMAEQVSWLGVCRSWYSCRCVGGGLVGVRSLDDTVVAHRVRLFRLFATAIRLLH